MSIMFSIFHNCFEMACNPEKNLKIVLFYFIFSCTQILHPFCIAIDLTFNKNYHISIITILSLSELILTSDIKMKNVSQILI